MNVVQLLGTLGGVASRWQLLERGATEWEIGQARHDGRIIRVRRAWYALPGADRAVITAVRVGGMLTCSSLLHAIGTWAPSTDDVHVSVAANASRLRSAQSRYIPRSLDETGIVLHWRTDSEPTTTARDTVAGALAALSRCAPENEVVAATDAVLHQRLTSVTDLRRSGVPQSVLHRTDPTSESGGESLVRLRLRSLQIAYRAQVQVAGVGRVDFVIGERLVLEVDGYAFHGDRDAFERDRERDLQLTARGYLVLRVSYRQIREEWPRVERALLAIIRSGRHRQTASRARTLHPVD